MIPTTEAGKALLDDYYANDDAREGVGYSLGERIAAIEREAREGYVPASLSPEWHAELSMSFDEGREAGAQQERERLRALLHGASGVDGLIFDDEIDALLSDPEPQP